MWINNAYKGWLIFSFLALQFFVFCFSKLSHSVGSFNIKLILYSFNKSNVLDPVPGGGQPRGHQLRPLETEEDEEVSFNDIGRFTLGFRSYSSSATHLCQRVCRYVCLYVLILLTSLPSPP